MVKMATGAPAFRQDMPPSGGYKPIDYKRIPARQYFSGMNRIFINLFSLRNT